VYDEEERDAMVVIGSTTAQVVEASAEPAREVEDLEELLEDDDSTERSELLIFEPEMGYAAR
jgi:hypothetical protein